MRAFDAKLPQQQPAVLGVIGHADRPLDPAAASETDAVVPQHPVALGKDRLREQRLSPPPLTPQWITTTGSPDPRSSYSTSKPSIAASFISASVGLTQKYLVTPGKGPEPAARRSQRSRRAPNLTDTQ